MCDGSFAEYAAAKERNLALKPANLGFEQSAAVPVSALTALQGVRDKGEVRAGQKVLVIGAAGGVGHFAVQIAKAFGAEVTGACSTTKMELVQSIGAAHVIDYTQDDIAGTGQRFDLILDTAGARPVSHLRRALTPRGTLVIVGAEGGNRWTGGVGRSLRAVLFRPSCATPADVHREGDRKDLEVLKELVEAGKVTPVIDRTYPLSQTADAMRHLEREHARGKIVHHRVTPGPRPARRRSALPRNCRVGGLVQLARAPYGSVADHAEASPDSNPSAKSVPEQSLLHSVAEQPRVY